MVLRFARGNRTLAALLLSKTTFGVGTGVIVMLAIFGRDVFDAGDAGIGLLFAARGLGALIGPFLARSIVGLTDRGLLLGIAGSFVTFAVGYSLLPLSPLLWLGGGLRLRGAPGRRLAVDALVIRPAARLARTHIRGRVFSFDYGLVTVTIALSTLVAGSLAERPAAGDHDVDHGRAGRHRGSWAGCGLARPIIRGPATQPAGDDREAWRSPATESGASARAAARRAKQTTPSVSSANCCSSRSTDRRTAERQSAPNAAIADRQESGACMSSSR